MLQPAAQAITSTEGLANAGTALTALVSLVTLIVSLWTRASIATLETRLTKEAAADKEKAADRCQKCRDQLRRDFVDTRRPAGSTSQFQFQADSGG